jgi:hypothetical protein
MSKKHDLYFRNSNLTMQCRVLTMTWNNGNHPELKPLHHSNNSFTATAMDDYNHSMQLPYKIIVLYKSQVQIIPMCLGSPGLILAQRTASPSWFN